MKLASELKVFGYDYEVSGCGWDVTCHDEGVPSQNGATCGGHIASALHDPVDIAVEVGN